MKMLSPRCCFNIKHFLEFVKGKLSLILEDSIAIFITTNSNLAKVVNEFYYELNDSITISPCITDYTLTNILWLKTPSKAPSLPMKRIIADATRQFNPMMS